MSRGIEHISTIAIKRRVNDYVIAGASHEIIARLIGIDVETLKKHYKFQLETALSATVADISNCVVAQAREGCEKSQALFLKTRGAKHGWVEKQVIENVDSAETEELKATIAALEAKHQSDY
jgi:phage I-like protein